MSKRHQLTKDEWRKVQYYVQLMSTQLSLYATYGALLVAIEGIGLTVAIFIKDSVKAGYLGIIAAIGIVVAGLLLWACYNTAIQIDRFKNKILTATKSTDMEETIGHWKGWPYQWYEKRGKLWRVLWMTLVFTFLLVVWCWIAFAY